MRDPVTAEDARAWLAYDPETGVFLWKESPNRNKRIGTVAGTVSRGRRLIALCGKKYKAHRLAWLLVHGEWPSGEIDHWNGDALDNRMSNLRVVTHKVNAQNKRKPPSNNKTGFLGVTVKGRVRKRFIASIEVDGKSVHIGSYSDPKTAHLAYVEAKREHHEGCTL